MKLRVLMKISVFTSIVLFCTALIAYLFLRMTAVENNENFNLYKLVPTDAVAVLEINDVEELIGDIDELDCSRDHHFLYISHLFSLLKTNLYALKEESAHGLSRQMNQMLLSFHEPDSDKNQVLYCSLGTGDFGLIERLIQKYFLGASMVKTAQYKGKDIRIYPMPDGSFLSCYVTSQFVAVSFQKKLIEQVMDAYSSGHSLSRDPSFKMTRAKKQINGAVTISVRMQSLDMGKMTDGAFSTISLGGWTEFDVRMGGKTLYFTGVSHDTDTCLTFMNVLRKQRAIEGFLPESLPATTFFFSRRSVSDLQTVFDFTSEQAYLDSAQSSYMHARDAELIAYLQENGGVEMMTCVFENKDTAAVPAVVMSFSINDPPGAERMFKNLLKMTPGDPLAPLWHFVENRSIASQFFPVYRMPRNTLFARLTGIGTADLHTYACFYGGRMLLSPDPEHLLLYIECIENDDVIDLETVSDEGISDLSELYHFMLFSDLEKVFDQPENYVRLIPGFFFRNAEFFRHFKLSAQFTCTDGVVSPNVVLLYKGD